MSYDSHQETPLSATHFDDNDKRYRLCCCHVKTWTLVIGIIELVGLIIEVIATIATYASGSSGSSSLGGMIFGIIMLIAGIAVVVLLIQGVRTIKPNWLIPHMVWQVVTIASSIISAIIYFVAAGSANSRKTKVYDTRQERYDPHRERYDPNRERYDPRRENAAAEAQAITGVTVGGGVALLIAAAISGFFLWVVFRCYKYLKNKVGADQGLPMGSGSGYGSGEKGIRREFSK